jgi:arginyl-tRNA synthetase
VGTEYYINDAGNQMATLGRSVLARAAQMANPGLPFPDNHYRGDYIKELASEYLKANGFDKAPDINDPEAVAQAAAWAGHRILNGIKDDLKAFQVEIKTWYSEKGLVDQGGVQKAFAELTDQGRLYEQDDALWFKATEFGDEKDRVVRRSNGETTYFASDIAYHLDKFKRGYERLINVWGADHHGYVPRLKAAVEAMGKKPEDLEIVLVQLVNLLRAGEPVAMSTRAGEFVTLREVVDEVGSDSARYIFLTRRSDSPLDFDLELAKQKSMDNPVYYVQYAHTRVKSVSRKAVGNGLEPQDPKEVNLAKLKEKDEIALARRLNEYPEVVASAAKALEPHRITYYLGELAGEFHSFYNARRIMVDDRELAQARMLLARAVGQVLAGGLSLLGVSAPEVM